MVPRVHGVVPVRAAWTVRGRVRSACHLSPEFLSFWDDLVQGTPFPTKRVQVCGHCPLQNVTAKYDPSAVSVRVSRGRDVSTSFELEVAPQKSLPSGHFSTEVFIQPLGADGVLREMKSLKVQGVVQGEIQVFPSHEITFGVRRIGEEAVETLVLRSVTAQPIQLEGFQVQSQDITVTPLPDVMMDGKALRVTQHVTRQGPQSAMVDFVVRGHEGAPRVVAVEVTYYGTSP